MQPRERGRVGKKTMFLFDKLSTYSPTRNHGEEKKKMPLQLELDSKIASMWAASCTVLDTLGRCRYSTVQYPDCNAVVNLWKRHLKPETSK